jgi:hypothetical protein
MTYPATIPPVEECENIVVHDALETLGINPQGTHASVVARLDSIDQRLTASERLFKTGNYGSIQATIDAAFIAGGGIVLLPYGVTTLPAFNPTTELFITLKPGVSLMGFGAASVLKVPDGAGNFKAVIGQSGNPDNSILSDFVIDGNHAGNAPADIEAFDPIRNEFNQITGFNKPRYGCLLTGANITLAGIAIRGLDSINHVVVGGANSLIIDCVLEAVCAFDHDLSAVYTTSGDGVRIERNRFVGGVFCRTAIETHNSNVFIRDNTIANFSNGLNVTGYVNDPLGTYALTVKDNHMLDCGAGVTIWSGAYGATPDNQQVCDLIVADNIIRLNSTLWPGATVDKGIRYDSGNTKPIGVQIIRDNLVRIMS